MGIFLVGERRDKFQQILVSRSAPFSSDAMGTAARLSLEHATKSSSSLLHRVIPHLPALSKRPAIAEKEAKRKIGAHFKD